VSGPHIQIPYEFGFFTYAAALPELTASFLRSFQHKTRGHLKQENGLVPWDNRLGAIGGKSSGRCDGVCLGALFHLTPAGASLNLALDPSNHAPGA